LTRCSPFRQRFDLATSEDRPPSYSASSACSIATTSVDLQRVSLALAGAALFLFRKHLDQPIDGCTLSVGVCERA